MFKNDFIEEMTQEIFDKYPSYKGGITSKQYFLSGTEIKSVVRDIVNKLEQVIGERDD